MDHPVVVALIAIVAFLVVWSLVALALCGGNLQRIILAKRAGWKICRDPDFAGKIEQLLIPPSQTKEKPDGTPLRVLTLLQREGRLLDFLMEEIHAATDEQIGAGVREIHQKCHQALKEHLELAPVLAAAEGESVTVEAGFDPSAIQVTGNVTGDPPFKGTLVHPGWRVKAIHIAKPAEGVDDLVVQPAEVEIS